MQSPQAYPLNPVDNIMLAVHESMRQRGYCGLNVMLIADVEGPLAKSVMAAALRRLGRAYPALSARVRFSRLLRRARWVIDADTELEAAIEYRHHYAAAEGTDVDGPLREAFNESIDPSCGPQLRLVHVQTGEDRHRIALVWAHHLMDLEGGHLLLGELDAILRGEPLTFGGDPLAPVPPPYQPWFPKSLWRLWQGRLRHVGHCRAHQPRIVAEPKGRPKAANFEWRRYDAALRRRFQAVARERTKPGPMRYSRGLLIAVARTYLEMCKERGRPREQYVFMQVLRLPREGPRPQLHGNFVSIPWITFRKDDLTCWAAADSCASRQLQDFTRKGRDEANWEMLRATARWPFPLGRYFAAHRMVRSAAGFSSFRFREEVTRLGRARIAHLVQVTTMSCHPGWIFSESTYGETMSISIGFFEDFIDPASVTEFLDRLERHLFGRPAPEA